MQFRRVAEKFTQVLAVAVVVIVIGLFIFMLAGCASWTNFIHRQAQAEYLQEIADECFLLDKTPVPCEDIQPQN